MKFFDIESCETVTISQLYIEYIDNKTNQPTEYNYSFADYIRNCLTENNGTLELIK